MSLSALYEASVLSALTDVLAYVEPPSLTTSASVTNQSVQRQQRADLAAPVVSIRWPSLPASASQLADALTLHDLLVLLIHAAILQHGAQPVQSPPQQQQHAAQKAAGSSAAPSPEPSAQPQAQPDAAASSAASGEFIPHGWNSSRGGYRLRYTLCTPTALPDPPAVYELRLLLLPLSHYLVIDANLHALQPAPVDGAGSAVSANHKLTLDVRKYVSVDELSGCLARWQEAVRERTDESAPVSLRLSAWVYRDVALLLSAVSNALIKRCMGPLSAHTRIHCTAAPRSQSSTLNEHQSICLSTGSHSPLSCALCSWPTFFAPTSSETRSQPASLPSLPVDLLLTVLLYLPSTELARLSSVSAAVGSSASHPLLWQWLCGAELDMSDRNLVAKDDWKSEFVIRRQRRREELYRNRFALVPVGVPVDVRDDRRLGGVGVGGVRGERPFFRLPFPLQPHALDDPLRFREWSRTGFGGWMGGGGY